MPQAGPSDYRASEFNGPHEQTAGGMDPVGEAAGTISETAQNVVRRTETLTSDLSQALRERPYTTLAIVVGVAFAVGALWRMSRVTRPYSSRRALVDQTPYPPNRDRLMGRSWWRSMPTRSSMLDRIW